MSIFLFTVVSLASEIAINPHQSTPKRNQVLENDLFARYVSEFIEPTVHFFAYDETAEGFLLKFIQPVEQDLTEKYLTNLLNKTYDTKKVSHTNLLISREVKFPERIVELLSKIPITRLKVIQQIEIEAEIMAQFTEQIFQKLKSAGIRIVIKAISFPVKGWPINILNYVDKIELVKLDKEMETDLLAYSDKIETINVKPLQLVSESLFSALINKKENINGGYFPKVHVTREGKFTEGVVDILSKLPITRLKVIQQIEIDAREVLQFTEQIFQRLKSAGIRIIIKAGDSHVEGTWPIYIFKFADKIEAVKLDGYEEIDDVTNLLEYSDKIEKIKLETWVSKELFEAVTKRKEKINGGYFPKVHLDERVDAIAIRRYPEEVGLDLFDSIQELEIDSSSSLFDRQYPLYLDIIHKVEIITISYAFRSEDIDKLLKSAKPKKIVLNVAAHYDLSKISSLNEVEINYGNFNVLEPLPFGNIKKLRIDRCGQFDMQSLFGLQRLESLYVSCYRISFHSLENFKKLKEIEYSCFWFMIGGETVIPVWKYETPEWMKISQIRSF